MKIRSSALAGLIVAAAFATVGCAPSTKTVIKLGYWINNTNERTNNKYIFDAFEAAYPEYQIEPVALAYDSYGEEIPRMSVGNTIPDVLWLREEYVPIFADKGIITPIDSFLAADPDIDLSLYINHAIEFSSYQSKIYGLPRDVGAQMMAFNLDIMGDEPLPSPDWTWDDMIALGQKMTITTDGVISQYGLGWTDWKALVTMNDGRLFSDDGRTALFNTPKVINALQMYSDLANVYHITPDSEASQGLGNPFTGKKAAFSVIGPWDFSRLKKANIRYDIRPLPQGTDSGGQGKVRLSGLALGIAASSTKKDAAYKFIKYLAYGEEAQNLQAQYSIAMPAIESIALSDGYTKSEYAPPSMDVYFQVLEDQAFVEQHFDGEILAVLKFNDYLYEIYVNVDGNMVTAESIKDEMNAAIQLIIDEAWENKA